MDKGKRKIGIIIFFCIAVVLMIGTIFVKSPGQQESIREIMRDAVLHETNKISLFGRMDVNPGLISAYTVTGIFLVLSLIVRIFVIPRFKMVPGKMQLLLETAVGYFDNLAKSYSPHRNNFLGAYIFTAGAYIFVGTILELFGIQVITTHGTSIALPAPLSDINGAIMMGCLSYLVILSGGIAENKLRGVGKTLKEFSLPISMSFRLFGALLSGALVTELVYYYIALRYGLPIIVGVLFTLLHALIQAYVLTMLTALFYGEVSEPAHEKNKLRRFFIMKKSFKGILTTLVLVMMLFVTAVPVFAASDKDGATDTTVSAEAVVEEAEVAEDNTTGDKAMAAAIVVGIAAAAGAIGMGWAIAKSVEGISRQPEAEGSIRTTLMLGLVFVETAIIYALVIAILIIFVL